MLIPNWVVDEVLVGASPTAFRLAIMLARHGTRVTENGRQEVQWKGQKQSLVRLVGASKTAIMEAQRELCEADLLQVTEPEQARGCFRLTLLLDKSPQNSGPVPEPEPDLSDHDADEYQQGSAAEFINIMNIPREHIRERLLFHGVVGADGWLKKFGPVLCMHAILAVEADERSEIMNPAGWMYRALTSGRLPPIDALDAVLRLFGVDSREYRYLKYSGMSRFREYRQSLNPEG